jgi:hypothetical protein
MTASRYDLVPLSQASLCLDCETITAANTNCLGCGSRALLNIARVLNGRRLPGLMYSQMTEFQEMHVHPSYHRERFPGLEASLRRTLISGRNCVSEFTISPSETSA